jgi:hypothetical protein
MPAADVCSAREIERCPSPTTAAFLLGPSPFLSGRFPKSNARRAKRFEVQLPRPCEG